MSIEIGAVKIKDGFFIGDVYAARDIEFVILNKITRIVNCAATEIPNIFEAEGILYTHFNWVEGKEQDYLIDKQYIDRTVDFLNCSIELGQSILIHSVRCQNRAVFMCACYLVRQLHWTANTAINFIYSRKEMPRMKPQLEKLVFEYERAESQLQELRSIIWSPDEVRRQISGLTPEELVLANTFLNMNVQEIKSMGKKSGLQVVQWNDKLNGHRSSSGFKNKLCTSYIPSYEQLSFTKSILQDASLYKPILKGSDKKFLQQNLMDSKTPHNIPQFRASSANPTNLNKTQKMRESSTKKLRFNKISDKENKELQNEFYETASFQKRNTLEINGSGKILKKENTSGTNFYRSNSKDKKLEAMLSPSKSKLTALYSRLNFYAPYQKLPKNSNKAMKKIASTKMIRPHPSNQAAEAPPSSTQVKSFMQGLIRMQQDFQK